MDLLLNPKMSKLLCYNMLIDVKHVVYLCDDIVDVVDSEMYLGNKLYNNIYFKIWMNLSVILKDEAITSFIFFSISDSFTLNISFPRTMNFFYGCALLTLINLICQNGIFHGGKYMLYFGLSHRSHNYIVSNLGNCITARRLCKYIYNLLHCENIPVQQIVKCKLLSPTTFLTDNYRYLCLKKI